MSSSGFWQELKRRHVYRVAVAYAVVGWLLIEIATQVFPVFHIPDWADQLVVLLIVIGFPIPVILAWAFEVTPEGVRRTEPVNSEDARPPEQYRHVGKRLNTIIISVLVLVVAVLLWQKFTPSSKPAATAPAVATAAQGDVDNAMAKSAASAAPAKSIAVLPFANLSGDPKQAYFSDGITEEILNALAQIPALKVAGRTSAFQFKSKGEDLRKIGETLGVANVLEGSVQKAGDDVRITVRLVDTRSGYQLWSESYDRKLTNIFAIEDEISNAIANKLRVQWSDGAARSLVVQQTIDPRAHDFYLRGLALLAARGPGLRDAVAAFQSAVQIAPDYAQAWGALAEAQALYPDYGLGTMKTAYSSALADPRHALSLSADLASAYVAQGMVYKNQWRWPDAGQAFRHALVLAPGDAEAVSQYAQFLLAIGQFEPALVEIERAQRLDPLAANTGVVRAYILSLLHRNHAAEAQIQSTLAAHPDFVIAHLVATDIAIALHHYPEAEKQAHLFAKLVGADPDAAGFLVDAIADPALRTHAVQRLKTSAADPGSLLDPIFHAQILVWLGARDRALTVLERFVIQRNSSHLDGLWAPGLDPIRSDPRFQATERHSSAERFWPVVTA